MSEFTVNGFPILGHVETPASHCTRPGRVIIVDRGEKVYQRYVTAWQGRDSIGGKWDSQWCHGHYIENWKEALADFQKRSIQLAQR